MSFTLDNQTADLVRRDEYTVSPEHAFFYQVALMLTTLAAVIVFIIMPCMFIFKNKDIAFVGRVEVNDLERNIRRDRPRYGHATAPTDFVGMPPECRLAPPRCPLPDDVGPQWPTRFMMSTSNVKTKIVNTANAAGNTLAESSTSMCQSLRRSVSRIKTSSDNKSVVSFGHVSGSGSRARRSLSVDLPVMKEPAWQKLASGALSPATTLGDFIRQAEPQDNNTRATTNAVTPTQTMGETLVGSPQPTHAEITQAQTTEAQTKMEKEDAGRIDDLISQMVVARDDASREVRGAAVEPQHDTQAQMQRQDGEDTHHNVLPPEPVFVAGMGIAR